MSYNYSALLGETTSYKNGNFAKLRNYNQYGFDRLGRLAPLTMTANPFFQYTIQPPARYVRPVYGSVGYDSLSGTSDSNNNYFSLSNAYDRY